MRSSILLLAAVAAPLACGPSLEPPKSVTVAPVAAAAPSQLAEAPPPALIAVGRAHSCAVLRDGHVACWGANESGQLGDETGGRPRGAAPIPGLPRVDRIAAAGNWSCALTPVGELYCWGFGQHAPHRVPLPAAAAGLSLISRFQDDLGCVVLTSGHVACFHPSLFVQEDGPAIVELPVDDAIAMSGPCVLRRGGHVACWTRANFGPSMPFTHGALGPPADVAGVEGATAIAAWSSGSAREDLSRGCAVLGGGGLACWGDAHWWTYVKGAQPTPAARVAGVEDARGVTMTAARTCVLGRGGGVSCWGKRPFGALAAIDTATKQPIDEAHEPSPLPGGRHVAAFAQGDGHACAMLESGRAQCWGEDLDGQLGDKQRLDEVVDVGVDAARVGVGAYFSCALGAAGDVVCWGSDDRGQLGDGTRTGRGSPAPVPHLGPVAQLGVGLGQTCAVERGGDVACWGEELRLPDRDDPGLSVLIPVKIAGLHDAVQVAPSHEMTCAVRRTGAVACWGKNDLGALGDGSATRTSRIVLVKGVSDAVEIAVNGSGGCAVRKGGGLVCWGAGSRGAWPRGQAPTPELVRKIAAPRAVPGVTDALHFAFGEGLSAIVVERSGRVRRFSIAAQSITPDRPPLVVEAADGASNVGGSLVLLKDGSVVELLGDAARPLLPDALTDVASVDQALGHGCAARRTGHVVCWGSDEAGELGGGGRTRSILPLAVVGL